MNETKIQNSKIYLSVRFRFHCVSEKSKDFVVLPVKNQNCLRGISVRRWSEQSKLAQLFARTSSKPKGRGCANCCLK